MFTECLFHLQVLGVDDLNSMRVCATGTGQAKGPSGEAIGQNDKVQQQAYLHLALIIISAFCRLPELAAMDESISKVSILVETLSSKYNLPPSFCICMFCCPFCVCGQMLASRRTG